MVKDVFYVVKVGKNPGIYLDVESFNESLKGFSGSEGKKFTNLSDAYLYLTGSKKLDYEIPEVIVDNHFDKDCDLRVYYIVYTDIFQGILSNKRTALNYTKDYIKVIGLDNAKRVFEKIKLINSYEELDVKANTNYFLVLNKYCNILTNNPVKMVKALDNESTVLQFNNRNEAEIQKKYFKTKKVYSQNMVYTQVLLKCMLSEKDRDFIYNTSKQIQSGGHDIVYTDGSYHLNNNLVGSAVLYKSDNLIFLHSSHQDRFMESDFLYSSSYAEIRSVIIAIETAILAGKSKITIRHDLKNLDDSGLSSKVVGSTKLYFAYYQYLKIARTVLDIKFEHVRGHSDEVLHNVVDNMCSIKNFMD